MSGVWKRVPTGDDPKAFPRVIALTVFTKILGGQRVRFETHCYDRVLKKLAQLLTSFGSIVHVFLVFNA